jgi:hypothetical protein
MKCPNVIPFELAPYAEHFLQAAAIRHMVASRPGNHIRR